MDFSSFFPIDEEKRLFFQIIPNQLKSWEIKIFEVYFILFCHIVRIVFQAQFVCSRKLNSKIKFQFSNF